MLPFTFLASAGDNSGKDAASQNPQSTRLLIRPLLTKPARRHCLLKSFITTLGLLLSAAFSARSEPIIIPASISFPRDTAVRSALLAAVKDFMAQVATPAASNTRLLKRDRLAASLLLDEMQDLRSNEMYRDTAFYKAYLTGLSPVSDSDYLVQIAYMGIHDDTPLLRASFTWIARRQGGLYYFCSPLARNAAAWKMTTLGKTVYYYKTGFNAANAKAYTARVAAYDKLLGAAPRPMTVYCCDDFHEALRLSGVDYKRDYNGYRRNTLSATEGDSALSVDGVLTPAFNSYDPHDLWHSRLRRVMPYAETNRPVDEGCAYLYGGSWGLSWADIVKRFKAFTAAHPDADWLALYNESRDFGTNPAAPLNVDFMLNALIVQQVAQQRGFAAVMPLLRCGKKQPDNANYFKALEAVAGISKSGFNAAAAKLVAQM